MMGARAGPADVQSDPRLGGIGNKEPITAADLQSATVREGEAVTVFTAKVPSNRYYWWGHGRDSRQAGRTSFIFLDLQDGTPTEINGKVVLSILDSTKTSELAREEFDTVQELRDAVNDSRSERPVLAARRPVADEDTFLALRIIADSGSDGQTIDPANSQARLVYSDAHQRTVARAYQG